MGLNIEEKGDHGSRSARMLITFQLTLRLVMSTTVTFMGIKRKKGVLKVSEEIVLSMTR
jgi:hypothetical protein